MEHKSTVPPWAGPGRGGAEGQLQEQSDVGKAQPKVVMGCL